jgi:hypothetical protein
MKYFESFAVGKKIEIFWKDRGWQKNGIFFWNLLGVGKNMESFFESFVLAKK